MSVWQIYKLERRKKKVAFTVKSRTTVYNQKENVGFLPKCIPTHTCTHPFVTGQALDLFPIHQRKLFPRLCCTHSFLSYFSEIRNICIFIIETSVYGDWSKLNSNSNNNNNNVLAIKAFYFLLVFVLRNLKNGTVSRDVNSYFWKCIVYMKTYLYKG